MRVPIGSAGSVSDPSVVKSPDGQLYYLYFVGGAVEGFVISLVESTDGIHWRNKRPGILRPTRPWEMIGSTSSGTVMMPSVVYDGTQYHMAYTSFLGKIRTPMKRSPSVTRPAETGKFGPKWMLQLFCRKAGKSFSVAHAFSSRGVRSFSITMCFGLMLHPLRAAGGRECPGNPLVKFNSTY